MDVHTYVTTAEAARMLGIKSDSVRVYCKHRDVFPGARKIGRDWWIPRSEVLAYKRKQVSG